MAGSQAREGGGHAPNRDRTINLDTAICYDLQTGAKNWRWQWDKTKGETTVYQASLHGDSFYIATDDHDFMFRGAKVNHLRTPMIIRLDAATGKEKWIVETKGGGDRYSLIFVQDDKIIQGGGDGGLTVYNKSDGSQLHSLNTRTGGCPRNRATANYIWVTSTSMKIGDDWSVLRPSLQGGRCHEGVFPGLGMVFGTNDGCTCDPFFAWPHWLQPRSSTS